MKSVRANIDNIPDITNVAYRRIAIFLIPILLGLVILCMSFISVFHQTTGQQFSDLANSFIHGHLYFMNNIGGLGEDPVYYHGRVFWDDGPFPAILLIPFVAVFNIFHAFFNQGYLQWLLILGICYFIFKIAKKIGFNSEDSLILAFGFILGSVFIGVAAISSSWLFAQVVTVFLLFWSLYEFYYRKRWWLLGIIGACIFLTRFTASPILIFFVLEMLRQKNVLTKKKITTLIKIGIPALVALGLLGLYNFLRFHTPFNGGFEYQLISTDSAEARSLGTFSLVHIPTNFYSAVLRAPVPVLRDNSSWTLKFPYINNNDYGMSLFVTSPYLITLFTNKWSSYDSRARNLLWASLVSCLLVFSYYGIGRHQYGFRYSLDFLPGLFVLFMIVYRKNHPRLSGGMKFLLLGSGIFNFFLASSFIFP